MVGRECVQISDRRFHFVRNVGWMLLGLALIFAMQPIAASCERSIRNPLVLLWW